MIPVQASFASQATIVCIEVFESIFRLFLMQFSKIFHVFGILCTMLFLQQLSYFTKCLFVQSFFIPYPVAFKILDIPQHVW